MPGGCFRLKGVNRIEKFINQGMSQKKWRKRVIMVLRAMGKTNGIKLIKGDVS